jgi:hypothetical protein
MFPYRFWLYFDENYWFQRGWNLWTLVALFGQSESVYKMSIMIAI